MNNNKFLKDPSITKEKIFSLPDFQGLLKDTHQISEMEWMTLTDFLQTEAPLVIVRMKETFREILEELKSFQT